MLRHRNAARFASTPQRIGLPLVQGARRYVKKHVCMDVYISMYPFRQGVHVVVRSVGSCSTAACLTGYNYILGRTAPIRNSCTASFLAGFAQFEGSGAGSCGAAVQSAHSQYSQHTSGERAAGLNTPVHHFSIVPWQPPA
jgi:hypothetical protein